MALFQWQKVDPTRVEIEGVLDIEACRAAGCRRLKASERRLILTGTDRSGSLSWGKAPKHVTSTWWTDHIGRQHWYVEGDQYRRHGEPHPMWRCRNGVVASPLEVIDPLHTAVCGTGEKATVLVVCDCGEVGSPESLGWAGDRCGPCFDRSAEEAGQPGRLAFHPHRTSVIALDFTADGRVLSVGYRDGSVHLHNPNTGWGTLLEPPAVHRGGAGAVVVPDHDEAVVAFTWGEVVCWDINSNEELWRTRCHGELMGIVASPDGERLAVDAVSVPYLLDANTGEGESASEDLSLFAFGPDGTLFAYDCDSRGVLAQDPSTGEWNATGLEFGEPEQDDCYGLGCSPTGGLLAAGGNGGRVRIGDLATGRWLHASECPASIVNNLDFAPDGRTLASGHWGTVLFQDPATGTEVGRLSLPAGGHVTGLAFSPDGETLAVGDDHGVVRLWPWRRMLEWSGDLT